MRKVIKIIGTTLSAIVLLSLTFVLIVTLLLNVESVQNFTIRKASSFASKSLGTVVSIDKIKLSGFNRVHIENFYVEDLDGDTLIYAQTLKARISKAALIRKKIVIGDISLDNGLISLNKPAEGEMNIKALTDKLIDRDNQKKSETAITLKNITLSNTRFNLRNEVGKVHKGGINWSNMMLSNINIIGDYVTISGKTISMSIRDMSFKEISGFEVSHMSMNKFIIGDGTLEMNKVGINTSDSEIKINNISLKGDGWGDYKDYVDRVKMDVSITKTKLTSQTLRYFAPTLKKEMNIMANDATLTFRGVVNDCSGTINNITVNETKIRGTYAIRNVTDFKNAHFNLDLNYISTNNTSISEILSDLGIPQPKEEITSLIAKGGELKASLKATGDLNDFNANVAIETEIGDFTIRSEVARNDEGNLKFKGNLNTSNLDVGYLTDNESVGRITMNSNAQGVILKGDFNLRGNVNIIGLELNGYKYSDVFISGSYNDKQISGAVTAIDPSLKMNLTGKVNLKNILPEYSADVNLNYADLSRLNIINRSDKEVLACNLKVDAKGNTVDNIEGYAAISNFKYIIPTDTVLVNNIDITKSRNGDKKHISLYSSFADAEFSTSTDFNPAFTYLKNFIYNYTPALSHNASNNDNFISDQNFDTENSRISIHIKDAKSISSLIRPDLNIAGQTHADLIFNPYTNIVKIDAKSDFIEIGDIFITKLNLSGDNITLENAFILKLSTADLFLSKLSLPFTNIEATVSNNRVATSIFTQKKETGFGMDLNFDTAFEVDNEGNKTLRASFAPSYVMIDNKKWNITEEGILYKDNNLIVNNFNLSNNGGGLNINGVASDNRDDILYLYVNKFDISPLSSFISEMGYRVSGDASGNITFASALKNPLIYGDILLDKSKVNNFDIVPLSLSSKWDSIEERVVFAITDRNKNNQIVSGNYIPSKSKYEADVNLVNIPFAAINPLFSGALTNSNGFADVIMSINGVNKKPVINGNINLKDIKSTVVFNKEVYSTDLLSINISDNIAILENSALTDSENNKIEVIGRADLRSFSNITYNIELYPKNIVALNTTSRDNKLFYGKIYTSGNVSINGNNTGIDIDANINTAGNSSFFMRLGGKSSVSQVDFIEFKSTREPTLSDILAQKIAEYKETANKKGRKRANVNLNINLNVTPNTLTNIMLADNNLQAKGSASLNFKMNRRNNEFAMFGNYEILEGDFIMNLQNIVSNKRFIISQGGTIQWTGEPSNALLNITATHRLRASLAPIKGIEPSNEDNPTTASSARVPIECIVKIIGNLSQPELKFEINAPNADADTQRLIASAISTHEKAFTQAVFLLAFNSFMSENDISKLTSDTSGLGMDFITNYLSNLISNDRMRISFGYRPDNEFSSGGEVDFGISTEITERWFLELEGNVDTDGKSWTNMNSGIVTGDVALTGILNKSGNLRMKFFSRPINRVDELLSLQESGMGIYYREDFNVFSDIIKQYKIRSEERRKQREERRKAKKAKVEAIVEQENENLNE